MKYASKEALLKDIQVEHDSLRALLREIPGARWSEPGVWGEAWSVSDLVAHLAEWHRMFLGWHADASDLSERRGTEPFPWWRVRTSRPFPRPS